jgi:uncharacterized delta-60 repeat protein
MPLKRLQRVVAFLLACLVLGATTTAWAASGDLDPTFGDGDGFVAMPQGGPWPDDEFRGLAIDPQGRIIAATFSASEPPPALDIHITRLERDGTPSPTFGNNGIATIDLGGDLDWVDRLYVRPNGKIVIEGSWQGENLGSSNHTIMQLTSEGQIDPSFGNQGALGFSRSSISTGMDNQGRLYVTVARRPEGGVRKPLLLRRFDSQGDLDPTFSGDGRRALPFPLAEMAVRGDGETAFMHSNPDCSCAEILALMPSGQVDPGFGSSGIARLVGAPELVAANLTYGPNGRLHIFDENDIGRLRPNGDPDTVWGGDGWVVVPKRIGAVQFFDPAFAFSSEGNYLAGSDSITRLHHNGTIDRSFGERGFVAASVSAGPFRTQVIAVGPPGEFVLGGYVALPGDTCACHPGVARLLT